MLTRTRTTIITSTAAAAVGAAPAGSSGNNSRLLSEYPVNGPHATIDTAARQDTARRGAN